jgi:hypothetical protein
MFQNLERIYTRSYFGIYSHTQNDPHRGEGRSGTGCVAATRYYPVEPDATHPHPDRGGKKSRKECSTPV